MGAAGLVSFSLKMLHAAGVGYFAMVEQSGIAEDRPRHRFDPSRTPALRVVVRVLKSQPEGDQQGD